MRDYVQLPDGTRQNLGTLSVLKFITKLVPSRMMARMALDRFNAVGETMVPVDLEQMAVLFVPRRARWSSVSSLIPRDDRYPTRLGKDTSVPMENDKVTIPTQLGLIEQQIEQIGKIANAGFPKSAVRAAALGLKELVAGIHLPSFGDQSKNDAFMGLGAPKVDTAEPVQKLPAEVTHPKVASFDALQENSALAEGILQQVTTTEERIDQLVTAGRKFNAAKAKLDLHEVSSKLSSLLQDVDMAQPWVKNDLGKLAARATEIHDLFATAKV